ncbi:MAG TPA: DUF1249 domain-containing protein [Candidatus Competibacteraceae bacterium]|nr:DUF1249 domain-containing protein [Candidatus Competibacteraceae bacterium]
MLVHTLARPAPGALDLAGTFAGLMDLYERNYIGIRRLVPELPAAGVQRVSRVAGGLDLHLTVLERFPYTSELHLTYHFLRDGVAVAEPDLRLRVYTDARLAEVMSAHLRHWPAFETLDHADLSQLHARWHVNRFLFKWLNYCLHQGHRFGQP